MRFSWTNKLWLAALSGVVLILPGAGHLHAQFAPINNPSQTFGQRVPAAGQAYGQPQVFGQLGNNGRTQPQTYGQSPQQTYGQAPQQSQSTQQNFVQTVQKSTSPAPQQNSIQPQQKSVQPQQSSYGQPQQPRLAFNPAVKKDYSQYQATGQNQAFGQNQLFSQNPSFGQPQSAPQYTARAFQDSTAEAAQQPAEAAAPDSSQADADSDPAPQAAPATSYGGYGGCDTCSVGYNTFDRGCGIGGYGCNKGCRRWFGGVYGLLMERDTSNYNIPLAYATSTGNAVPYYPLASEVVMSTSDAATGFQGGMELRIGATFGGHFGRTSGVGGGGVGYNTFAGGASGCPSAGCCGPTLAWEMVYWGLPEEVTSSTITDMPSDGTRTYGMMPYNGWEYNPGSGYRPLNDYFDYGSPTATNDIEIRSLTVRRQFSAQNLELNLLRLPILNGCGSRGACGCGPRYELTTLFGARFLRFDDDFALESNWENTTSNATGTVTFNSEIDNKLYGLQVGCNGACRFGSCGRWGLHCSTSVGVYGNSISARQWVPGMARYIGGANGAFDVTSSQDDVSMLGELRLGASYQYSGNWRFYGGWRAIGISGVATATDQIATTPIQAGWIDSSGSLILHGLQAGVECTY